MNIQLLCRINGAFVILNGLSALVAPSMWFSMAGFTAVGPAAFAICQALGVAAIGLGIISWRTVDIAGEAINAYGQLFGGIHILFILLTLYQMMAGVYPELAPAYFNLIASLILAAALFYYSRKNE